MGKRYIVRSVLWVRRDLPGHEACRVVRLDAGWQVAGVAVFAFEKAACCLNYEIDCDLHWVTRSAEVRGWVGDRTIEVAVVRNADGQWSLNGRMCGDVAGCDDLDLNFIPSTNLLPLRRLDLAIGTSAMVRAAWLRFPSFQLEPLVQSYTCLEHRRYRYESAGGRFVTELAVDETGLVMEYGKIWTCETAKSNKIF